MDWDLDVGDVRQRTAIQAKHHGSNSRGISAPAAGPEPVDIMLWWRPEHGHQYGYSDGWASDGAFYFAGTGQYGDQRFGAPNAENGRVRDHIARGDRVRLLRYLSRNQVRYIGQLRLDQQDPWQWRDGPDRLGRTRKMIQFRFLPIGDVVSVPGDSIRDAETGVLPEPPAEIPPAPTETDVEALGKKAFQRLVLAREQLTRREELQLVHFFRQWLAETQSIAATGLRIPTGKGLPTLRADLWIPTREVLVEAKASAAREHIRTAVGQLLDYARYVEPAPTKCVLVPTKPADDMLALLEGLGIACVWRSGSAFCSAPDAFFA